MELGRTSATTSPGATIGREPPGEGLDRAPHLAIRQRGAEMAQRHLFGRSGDRVVEHRAERRNGRAIRSKTRSCSMALLCASEHWTPAVIDIVLPTLQASLRRLITRRAASPWAARFSTKSASRAAASEPV